MVKKEIIVTGCSVCPFCDVEFNWCNFYKQEFKPSYKSDTNKKPPFCKVQKIIVEELEK